MLNIFHPLVVYSSPDRTGHPYDLIGSRYLLGEQELPLASERKQNSKANVEEDKPPGRDQSTVGFTGRPLFSNVSVLALYVACTCIAAFVM